MQGRHRRTKQATVGLCIVILHVTMKTRTHTIILKFLANVNSCSCSLYVVVRPSVVCRLSVVGLSVCRLSVCRLSVCLSSVCNVRAPYSADWNFRQCFCAWQHPGKILRRSFQGNPSVGGLNRVVEKFSDFGHLRGYISEAVQDRR